MSKEPDDLPFAELRTHTVGAGTLWLTQTPALALFRGEVGRTDWLRLEGRDGRAVELELPRGRPLRVGRVKPGMQDPPDVAHDWFVSSQAAMLANDGIRWWLTRRLECHEKVPVMVGSRVLGPGERAPLVHGTYLQVGQLRGTLVDRRWAVPTVPAGVVDAYSGLLTRLGIEHEIASALAVKTTPTLVLLAIAGGDPGAEARLAVELHQRSPRAPILRDEGLVGGLFVGAEASVLAERARAIAIDLGLVVTASGYRVIQGEVALSGRIVEESLAALRAATGAQPVRLDAAQTLGTPAELTRAITEKRRVAVLFGIEDAHRLARVGTHVLPALEGELAAIVAARAPAGSVVAKLADAVVGVTLPMQHPARELAAEVAQEWHSRPPVVDGKVELPRATTWEMAGDDAIARAAALSVEVHNQDGGLLALSGGLPYPIAGRVALAAAAGSAVERVKMLFDVLEGAWRFVACVLAAAAFVADGDDEGTADFVAFARAKRTRSGYPLGTWRELARLASQRFRAEDDAVARLVRGLFALDGDAQALDRLGDELASHRNHFAHNVYPEARAQRDLFDLEPRARNLLRALRPLSGWTLATVERAEPDPYGEAQTIDYVDHTGTLAQGTRRRVGLSSGQRLASVVYLARFREGLFVPLEPFLRRLRHGDGAELFWVPALPQAGMCTYQSVVHGAPLPDEIDPRRLPPRLRDIWKAAG